MRKAVDQLELVVGGQDIVPDLRLRYGDDTSIFAQNLVMLGEAKSMGATFVKRAKRWSS